jgi:glycosyltransferase involved in cell wall biosynthesis
VALHDAVVALANDPAKRARMGEVARRRARVEFDEGRVCERVIDLYCDLLAGTPQSVPAGRMAVGAYGSAR